MSGRRTTKKTTRRNWRWVTLDDDSYDRAAEVWDHEVPPVWRHSGYYPADPIIDEALLVCVLALRGIGVRIKPGQRLKVEFNAQVVDATEEKPTAKSGIRWVTSSPRSDATYVWVWKGSRRPVQTNEGLWRRGSTLADSRRTIDLKVADLRDFGVEIKPGQCLPVKFTASVLEVTFKD